MNPNKFGRNFILIISLFAMIPPVFSINEKFIETTRIALPSVVNITVWKKNNSGNYVRVGEGSGVIVSPHGFIVTNNHVLADGNIFRVSLNDGREYVNVGIGPKGESSLRDQSTDIALIKVGLKLNETIPAIKLGNSDQLQVGEWVLALGNPFGLRHTVTAGIVSAKGRVNVGFADFENFIQTDAAINPGNSGGALVNLQGELVGINTAIKTSNGGYQGISFAIPVNMVVKVSKNLLRHGRVVHGWLGFYIRKREMTNNLLKDQVEVESIVPHSPAFRAGLRKGDIITAYNGISIRSFYHLRSMIATAEVGEKISLKIQRENKQEELSVVVGKKPENERDRSLRSKAILLLGIELAEDYKHGGLKIIYVRPESPAQKIGLKRSDRLIELNQSIIKTIDDFFNAVEYIETGQKIRLMVNREGQIIYLYMDIDKI